MEKTLLVINTGSIKKRFVFQKLKRMGLTVIVLHPEKNWAQPYVDHWIIADNYNHSEAILNVKEFLAENKDIKIAGAITFWEDDVPLLAKICDELKLTGNDYSTAINTRDKFKMQEVFKNCGLPFINQHIIKNTKDLEKAITTIGFPAVIKPNYGSDSQFVIKVNDFKEAHEAYEYVLKNCTPEFDPIYKYNKQTFVYQEFIEGHEFSVECYIQHGVPHICGIHEKTAMDLPFFQETGDYIPPRINNKQEQSLVKITEAALIVLGVRNSLAHVEVKLSLNGPKVIEVASRLGGDYTHESVFNVYNFDLIKSGVEIALGMNVDSSAQMPKYYVMGKFFIPKTSGIITKIIGIDEARKDKNVIDLQMYKKVGDSILVPPEGYENAGWVLVRGQSYLEAESTVSKILEMIKIDVVPFKSYSSVGRTLRKNRFAPALLTSRDLIRSNKIVNIQQTSIEDLRKLHIGIVCNIYEGVENEVENDLMSVGKNIEKTLIERGYKVTFFDFNNLPKAFNELHKSDVDLVFNVCERINNSSLLEPHAASILDALQIPYTGSNPFTLALCIDKIRVKKLLAFHSIPTPKWDYAYILVIIEMGSPALVEEYIEGDEYDVSIIGSDENDLRVLPHSRSIFDQMPEGLWHIYPYEAKWTEDSPYNKIRTQRPPKNISKKLESLITEIALDTYNILDCHDYGRVEIRVDKNDNPYVLELNPNPSINIGDCVPGVAELIGMNYGDFIEEIIRMAIRRYKNKPAYYHLQTNLL
ncbi:ATP-grasp domain-containing protein [Candidatus Gottesmanbacteria bacterium]|nr:ATP-grasp domain-containing protein [Candidatus Gottesmanbacteria bacterium]